MPEGTIWSRAVLSTRENSFSLSVLDEIRRFSPSRSSEITSVVPVVCCTNPVVSEMTTKSPVDGIVLSDQFAAVCRELSPVVVFDEDAFAILIAKMFVVVVTVPSLTSKLNES